MHRVTRHSQRGSYLAILLVSLLAQVMVLILWALVLGSPGAGVGRGDAAGFRNKVSTADLSRLVASHQTRNDAVVGRPPYPTPIPRGRVSRRAAKFEGER